MASPRVLASRAKHDIPPSKDLTQVRHILPFLKPYRWQIAGVAVSLTLAAATVLAFGAGLRWLIDSGFLGGETKLLDEALAAMIAIILVLAAATFARSYLVAWVGERLAADIRNRVYGNILDLSPAFYEITRTGEVLSRLTADTGILQTVVGSSISMALRNVLMVVGGIIMMAVTSPKLTALTLMLVPAVVVPLAVFGRRLRIFSRLSQDKLGEVSSYASETLGGIETVQSFNYEPVASRRFAKRVEEAFEAAVRRSRARAGLAATVILMVFAAVAFILWIGGHDMLAGRISPGELSAFVFYAIVVASSIGTISEFYGDLQRAAGASERLVELMHEKPAIRAPDSPVSLPVPARGDVELSRVTFAYPSRQDRPALEGFSLRVEKGQRIALVGPSGAGKTTVFQLLLRFYDPQAGRITIDGVDIRDADPRAVRERYSVVSQDPVIFATSIEENIRYGRPDASGDDVRRAADAAAAIEFIEKLPDGFATPIGERGMGLSGGQRQRIAIARAILRDPAVLLLDEATSALDAESERTVQMALDKLMAGRTTIVIAHRLATVLKADNIVVMDEGRIVATGRHEELVEKGGLYARLAALQFETPALVANDDRRTAG